MSYFANRITYICFVSIFIAMLHSADALENTVVQGPIGIDPIELRSMLQIVKKRIEKFVPWGVYGRWASGLQVPPIIGNGGSSTDFEESFILEWEKESGKTLRFPVGEMQGDDTPSLHIEVARYTEDVLVVRINHGLPLAGSSRELVFLKVKDDWILRREIPGGHR